MAGAGTLLASAARTTQQSVAGPANDYHSGVLLTLTVTAASGTGGLSVRIWFGAADVANYANAAPIAVTATGKRQYLLYPGVGAGTIAQQTSSVLPPTWGVDVTVGDASSYTYGLTYELLR